MSLFIFINSGAFVRFTVDGWDPFAIENHKYSHESELQVYLKLLDGGIKPSQRWSSKKTSQTTLACFLVVHFNHYYYSTLHVLHAHTHYLYLGFFKSRYQLISACRRTFGFAHESRICRLFFCLHVLLNWPQSDFLNQDPTSRVWTARPDLFILPWLSN